MQFRSFFISILFIILLTIAGKAQDCAVAMASLTGKYEGECKKGKADGMGKAVGEDTYEGMFKAGLPSGKGKYTWKNGNWFDGEWLKGMKQGAGTMRYNLPGKDSIATGFWKKDKYTGLYETPYIIYKRTVHVTAITFQQVNNWGKEVEFFLNTETVTSISNGGIVTKAEITDIQIIAGNYHKKTINDSYGKKIGYHLEEMTFPFRAIFSIDNGRDMFELEIFEPGKWMVEVRNDN
jgi:hypothetical protein